MGSPTKILFFVIIILLLQSCACSYRYELPIKEKKKHYYKAGGINGGSFHISPELSPDNKDIHLVILTNESHLDSHFKTVFLNDSITKVNFIDCKLSFADGTILNKYVYEYSRYTYYSVGKELKKPLNLNIIYTLDSLGVVTHHEEEYRLVRKRYCRFGFH